MHECNCPTCKKLVDDKYMFCHQHREYPYRSMCNIHGCTAFSLGKCIKCENLKKPEYRVKIKNKYIYLKDKRVDYVKPYIKWLTNKTQKYHKLHSKRIINGPGIYGIFVKDGDSLGKCLYVGQSVNVKNRIACHKRNIVKASNQVKGCRAKSKKTKNWKKLIKNYKVDKKYYILQDYKLSNLKFVTLIPIDNKKFEKLNQTEKNNLLCILEQLEMDVFKPKTNTFASRPSGNKL